jgi:sugar-specific transcriptional regulator TrmB
MNISKEAQSVYKVIKQYGPIRSTEIVKKLNISTKTVYKHLSKLQNEELIEKTGSTPMVFYAIKSTTSKNTSLSGKDDYIINDNYLYVSPNGEMISGIEGFQEWCRKNNFNTEKEKKTFIEVFKTSQKIKKDGLISAKKSILSGNKKLYLDNIFFNNFYTIGHFGKTKLGQLVYLGKSSQNKALIIEIVKIVRPSILKLIEKYDIKFVCFIPPTIDRKLQFMEVFKKNLKLDLLEIKAIKVPSLTKVPQKTLRKLEDRIINANKTIAVSPNQEIDANVLIIDDATGSGATLNETASKIKNIAKGKIKIIGYSVIGSYKGFDIISEV